MSFDTMAVCSPTGRLDRFLPKGTCSSKIPILKPSRVSSESVYLVASMSPTRQSPAMRDTDCERAAVSCVESNVCAKFELVRGLNEVLPSHLPVHRDPH